MAHFSKPSGSRWGTTELLVGGVFVLTIGLAITVHALRNPDVGTAADYVGGFLIALGLALLLPGAVARGLEVARRDVSQNATSHRG